MKTVIEMAREAGIELDLIDEGEGQVWYITKAGLERLAELVRADEREACAKVCDYIHELEVLANPAEKCAAAIRAKGQTP